MDEMLELSKQVQINIPFLNTIKTVPSYAKFLKDFCTQKRRMWIQVPKKVMLTEHVSAVLTNQFPPKLKDLDAPIISCVIGNIIIERALLDLGVNVNLLPARFTFPFWRTQKYTGHFAIC